MMSRTSRFFNYFCSLKTILKDRQKVVLLSWVCLYIKTIIQ